MSAAEGDAHSGGSEENAEAENGAAGKNYVASRYSMCARGHLLQGVEMGPQIDPPGPWKAKTDAFQKGAEQLGKLAFFSTMVERRNQRETYKLVFEYAI